MNLAMQLKSLTAAVAASRPTTKNHEHPARNKTLRSYRLAQAAQSQTEWSQTVLAALGDEAVKGTVVAERLKASSATAYRWLVTLETAGYVTHTGYNHMTRWSRK